MIYAMIVLIWAAFLVPMWLRRHDENAEAKSVDKFATKMRVLARRPADDPVARPASVLAHHTPAVPAGSRPVSSTVRVLGSDRASAPAARTGTAVVTRARTTGSITVSPHQPTAPTSRSHPRERAASAVHEETITVLYPSELARATGAGRSPSSLAARRRRVLVGLVVITAALVGLGVASVVPLWASAFGWAALIGYLAHLRVQARRSADIARRRARAQRQQGTQPVDDSGIVRISPPRPARTESAEDEASQPTELDEAAGSWRPVSFPVPTYVTAPRASRAIRRIDLGASESWTSGRLVTDAAAAGKAAAAAAHHESVAARDADDTDVLRAVGD